MKDKIIRRKQDGSLAVVTHWKHFHVNRVTGRTISEAFTVEYLNGGNEGLRHVWPTHMLHSLFEITNGAI